MDTTKDKIPIVLKEPYFTLKSKQDDSPTKNVTAVCNACNKIYSGSLSVTSNFLLHLKTKHKHIYDGYINQKKGGKTDIIVECVESVGRKRKHSEIESKEAIRTYINATLCSRAQQKCDELILNYILSDARSLNTVTSLTFRDLIEGISQLKSPVQCMSKCTLQSKIGEKYNRLMSRIKDEVFDIPYVCVTADVWTAYHKSYLGVTLHWISKEFERKSYAIACERFTGTHDFKRIAQHLCYINENVVPFDKTVAIITDNGSNFVKAFKLSNIDIVTTDGSDDDGDDEGDINTLDGEFMHKMENVTDILENRDEYNDISYEGLPRHYRCPSQMLTLICTTDINNFIKQNNSFGFCFYSAMGICSALWNKTNKSSTKAYEIYVNIIGAAPITPIITVWNSTYDALCTLLQVDEENLNDVCHELNLIPFSSQDIEFLTEYTMVLKNFAIAFGMLQSEQTMFMGDFIPCLYAIKCNLEQINNTQELQYCNDFCTYLERQLEKRFRDIFSKNLDDDKVLNLFLATMTHPKWKQSSVLDDNNFKDNLKKVFFEHLKRECANMNKKHVNIKQERTETENEFYSLIIKPEASTSSAISQNDDLVELEGLRYLCDSNIDFDMLLAYPTVLKLFLKYNTAIPSSAAVERLFGLAGLIMPPQRTSLSDENFEQMTLLRCNNAWQ